MAKKIRTAEAQLQSELRKVGKQPARDLRDVSINPKREMVMNPGGYPAAKRAKTAQSNLEPHYRRWAVLCEHHLTAVGALDEDSEPDSTE